MAKLLLNKHIYSEKSVKEACTAYKELAHIHLRSEDPYFVLEFDQCKYDLETTIKDFENYVINAENIK